VEGYRDGYEIDLYQFRGRSVHNRGHLRHSIFYRMGGLSPFTSCAGCGIPNRVRNDMTYYQQQPDSESEVLFGADGVGHDAKKTARLVVEKDGEPVMLKTVNFRDRGER